MDEQMYRHVLFKDLKEYLKRTDYFSGYTDIEKAWIKKNLDLNGSYINSSVGQLRDLIKGNNLNPGCLYTISYLEKYTLVLLAISENKLSKSAILITDDENSLFWDIKYDLNQNKIVYMKDHLYNEAPYDFKFVNKVFEDPESCGNSIFATNIIIKGKSNNNKIYGNNIQINVPVCNLIGEANNIIINEDVIDLSSSLLKTIIKFENKYYIDYLDLETLTHQFYAVDTVY